MKWMKNSERISVKAFYKVYLLVLLFSSMLIHGSVYAQKTDSNLTVQTYSIFKLGNGDLPFWMWANKRGKVNSNSSALNLDILYTIPERKAGIFFVSGGIDGSTSLSEKSTLNFSQLFYVLRYKGFELSGGRFNLVQGLNSKTPGFGPFITSRNATAMPGFEFRTKEYLQVPFMQGYLNYKASIAHFWFENNRPVTNAWLHNKQFYLQIDFDWLTLNGGIIHNVMWGGSNSTVGDLPSAFSDYIRVFFAQGAQSNFELDGEVLTALGNNLAGYDFGISLIGKEHKFDVSRLFYLEDKNAAEFRSVWDGQWSMNIIFSKNRFIKNIAYDHIYTIRQDAYKSQPGGRANYFNHHIYRSGWTYQGNVIGNPLLTYNTETRQIINNMIVGHTLISEFQINSSIKFTPSFAYTRNYGVCKNLISPEGLGCGGAEEKPLKIDFVNRAKLRKDYYFLSANIDYTPKRKKNMELQFSIGYDFKEKEYDNIGFSIGLKFNPYY